MRSRSRCSKQSAIHIMSHSWLRSSSTHEPSDPPHKVVQTIDSKTPKSSADLIRLTRTWAVADQQGVNHVMHHRNGTQLLSRAKAHYRHRVRRQIQSWWGVSGEPCRSVQPLYILRLAHIAVHCPVAPVWTGQYVAIRSHRIPTCRRIDKHKHKGS